MDPVTITVVGVLVVVVAALLVLWSASASASSQQGGAQGGAPGDLTDVSVEVDKLPAPPVAPPVAPAPPQRPPLRRRPPRLPTSQTTSGQAPYTAASGAPVVALPASAVPALPMSAPVSVPVFPQPAATPPVAASPNQAPGKILVPQQQQVMGPHTGALVMKLPVNDLKKPKGGVWQGNVKLKQSTVTTFEGEPVVKVFYKKGSGTSSMPFSDASGCSFSCENPAVKGQTGIVVAFDIYFAPGAWQWSKGGKIGGLFVGPGVASGYRHSDNGASHRMMWQREGGAISYVYPPAKLPQADPKLKPDGHGIGYFGNTFGPGTLKIGQWNHVEIGVKVNTFTNGKPNPDGKSMLTINGKSGVLDNVRWAKSPDLKIHAFEFSTFFGGPDPATVDSTLYAKNFEVYAWKN